MNKGTILMLPNEAVMPSTYEKLINGAFELLTCYPKVNPWDRDEVFGVFILAYDWDPGEEEIPEDLKRVLQYAKAKDIAWVMLDRDADDFDELKLYSEEWRRNALHTETVTELSLLKGHMEATCPKGLFAVQDFCDMDSEAQGKELEAVYRDAGYTLNIVPGLTIIEIDKEIHKELKRRFDKSGVDIWIFEDGLLIDEMR